MKLRTTLLPGITGLSQVRLRNDLTWNQKLSYDKFYCDLPDYDRFIIDLKIIIFTIYSIFKSEGVFDKR